MPDDPEERLEYARRHLGLCSSEKEYQEARARVKVIVETQRKEKELERMRTAEWHAISRLEATDPSQYAYRMRVHRLQYDNGLTEQQAHDQIEAQDREQDAAQREREERRQKEPPMQGSFRRLLTREKLDAMHRNWNDLGISHDEQAKIVQIFNFKPEPKPQPSILETLQLVSAYRSHEEHHYLGSRKTLFAGPMAVES